MKYLTITALLLLTSIAYSAEEAVQIPPCSGEEYNQFDFWVGEWEVFNPQGQKVGENRVEKILGGCSVQENWVGESGNIGHSFNIYDRTTASWHQTWVDNSGTLLKLNGALSHRSMILQGVTKGPKGPVLNQITWTPKEDGTVKQLWEVSVNKGGTWVTVFDGTYKKKQIEGE